MRYAENLRIRQARNNAVFTPNNPPAFTDQLVRTCTD